MSSDFYKSRLDSIHENETNSDENNEVCDFIYKTHLLQKKRRPKTKRLYGT